MRRSRRNPAQSGKISTLRVDAKTPLHSFILLHHSNRDGLLSAPANTTAPSEQRRGGAAEFFSTFLVVLLNPSTFVMFLALFTLAGMTGIHVTLSESLKIASAVFVGAFIFGIVLALLIQRAKGTLNEALYQAISRIASYVILAFGIAILISCLYVYVRWQSLR